MNKILCGTLLLVLFFKSCKKTTTIVEEPITPTPTTPTEPKVYSFETTPSWSDEFDGNG